MAGSLNHIVGEDGRFKMSTIENLGDASEALEECFHVIRVLTGGSREKVNEVLRGLHYPSIRADMVAGDE